MKMAEYLPAVLLQSAYASLATHAAACLTLTTLTPLVRCCTASLL